MRGAAALAVTIHHNLLAAGLLSAQDEALLLSTPLASIAKGRHAVMFFFVLSGFVLTRALSSFDLTMDLRRWVAWGLQRTLRLGLPVAGSLALSAGLYCAFYAGTWSGESW